ncbi:MAG TPA: DUF134 domain-containing protein [Dehalococcoidia bacterium]|nr:DUF134 domain-containing protein [Dehalococcoidia bacterium]
MSVIVQSRDKGSVGRPIKWRRVAFTPQITYFKPAGTPAGILKEVRLSVEEAEAIRLKDLEELEQEECAERMNISRPTFHRVLGSARCKLADALLNGKAIRIDGGNFEMAIRRFRCNDGHEWNVPFEAIIGGAPQLCPTCNSQNILPLQPTGLRWGRGRRRGRHI